MHRRAYAKVTLCLHVEKRVNEDLYFKNITVPIDLFDMVYLDKSEVLTIESNKLYIPNDNRNTVYKAIQLMKQRYDISDNFRVKIVKNIPAQSGLGGGSASDEQVQAQFVRFRELLLGYYQENPPVALPGVVEALQHLAASGTKIALTTGFSRDVADIILDGLGWKVGPGELLDAVVAGDETAAGRPAPYMIHRAMELTGVRDVAKVVAAGDTANDLLAAHHAGVHGIGVLTGKLGREDLERYPHAAILESVAGLPGYLAAIESEAA